MEVHVVASGTVAAMGCYGCKQADLCGFLSALGHYDVCWQTFPILSMHLRPDAVKC